MFCFSLLPSHASLSPEPAASSVVTLIVSPLESEGRDLKTLGLRSRQTSEQPLVLQVYQCGDTVIKEVNKIKKKKTKPLMPQPCHISGIQESQVTGDSAMLDNIADVYHYRGFCQMEVQVKGSES